MAEPKAKPTPKPKQYTQAEVNSLIQAQVKKGRANLTNFGNKVRRAHEEQKRKEALFSPMVVDSDPGAGIYQSSTSLGLQIIPPRFAFHHLKAIVEKSDITQALIDVMKKNIEGFGYGLRFLGDDLKASDPVNATSKERLSNFFDYANESESWATISGHRRHDMEHFGFGAIEFMRTTEGEIAAAYYVPVELLRATTYEDTITPVSYSMKRDGKVVTVPFKKYFRRWVQLKPDGTIQRYFKELGDPREIDSLTGKYTPGLPIAEQATEIMVQTIFYGNYVYGMPRWLGACMDILGRRNAQQVNWDLFESQGIPRMVVMVSGGTLTEASYQSLEDLLVEAQGIANYNKVTLLEANSDSLGLDDKTNTARIDFKNLSEARQDDQMFTRYLEQTRNDIRGIYRIPPLYLGGVSDYCHSDDTETLTENGWKLYTEVLPGEKIAVVCPESQELTFEVPEGLHVFDYAERDMVRFEAQAVDFLVTDAHGMYTSVSNTVYGKDKPKQKADWQKIEASDLLGGLGRKRYDLLCSPVAYTGSTVPDDIPIPDKELFLEFMGMVVADGHITKNPPYPSKHTVTFAVKKERKKRSYSGVCKALSKYGADVRIYPCHSRKGYIQINVISSSIWEWCEANLLTPDREKKLPNWVHTLNSGDADLLLSALIFGDGSESGPNSRYYATSSKALADQVQILALLSFYRAHIKIHDDDRENRRRQYIVQIADRNITEIRREQVTRETYTGKVYCFHVNNRLFITRRNGKVGISFNTLATSRAAVVVAEGQVFIPERILSDEPINRKIIQQQFGCYDWGFYSKGARITAPEDIANVVKAFGKTGAFTVNHTIAQANEAFGLSMSQFKEPWANYPYDLVIELLRKGELKGLEKITKEVQDNAAQVDNFQKKNDLGNVDELVKAKSKSLPNTKVMRSMLKPNELALFTTMERLNTLMAIASEMPEDGGN